MSLIKKVVCDRCGRNKIPVDWNSKTGFWHDKVFHKVFLIYMCECNKSKHLKGLTTVEYVFGEKSYKDFIHEIF